MLSAIPVFANLPGGGTGTGPNVTLVDNGDGTVTMANGIVSIHINKASAVVDQINYTFNNNGSTQTLNVLAGGNNGGQLYWEFGGFSTGSATANRQTGRTTDGPHGGKRPRPRRPEGEVTHGLRRKRPG